MILLNSIPCGVGRDDSGSHLLLHCCLTSRASHRHATARGPAELVVADGGGQDQPRKRSSVACSDGRVFSAVCYRGVRLAAGTGGAASSSTKVAAPGMASVRSLDDGPESRHGNRKTHSL